MTRNTRQDVIDRQNEQLFTHLVSREGATVQREGGTFGLYWEHYKGKGFAVSVPGYETRIGADALDVPTFGHLATRYEEIRRGLRPGVAGNYWVGLWYDKEHEHVYFDISEIFELESEAMEAAREAKQLAYYSFEDWQAKPVIEKHEICPECGGHDTTTHTQNVTRLCLGCGCRYDV